MTSHIIQCPSRGKAIVDVAHGHSPPAQFVVEFASGEQQQWNRWEWRDMVDHYIKHGCQVVYRGFVTDEIRVTHEADGSHTIWVEAWHGSYELCCSGNGPTTDRALKNFWFNWNRKTKDLKYHTNLSIAFRRRKYRERFSHY